MHFVFEIIYDQIILYLYLKYFCISILYLKYFIKVFLHNVEGVMVNMCWCITGQTGDRKRDKY